VSLLFDNGTWTSRDYHLPAKSRTNVPIGVEFPFLGPGGRFSILVESLGVPPVPIVVERASYASPAGVAWASGGNAVATPIP
jgi:hypothetical protein